MESNKQTAIEWYSDKLLEILGDEVNKFTIKQTLANYNALKQAKKLEKQQIEKCAIFFTNYAIDKIENKTDLKGEEQFEQYYNETFNK